MEREKIIETIDLRKVYGVGEVEVLALDGINIQIHSGEFVAIMGPSGSGKSTLMNILACLDTPTEGQYILAGEDISGYSRAELAMIRSRLLGFVFQSFNLLPRATALDNVMMPMIYRREDRISLAQRRELAYEKLEMVGLGDRTDHIPSQLSGGQQQRVAIARALINEPIMILADEPTGNLDTKSSEEILGLLHDLHDQGRTIVMVTHDIDIALHTERIINIRDGKIYSDHPNDHVLTRASLANAIPQAAVTAAEDGRESPWAPPVTPNPDGNSQAAEQAAKGGPVKGEL